MIHENILLQLLCPWKIPREWEQRGLHFRGEQGGEIRFSAPEGVRRQQEESRQESVQGSRGGGVPGQQSGHSHGKTCHSIGCIRNFGLPRFPKKECFWLLGISESNTVCFRMSAVSFLAAEIKTSEGGGGAGAGDLTRFISVKFKVRVIHHLRSWLSKLQGETAPSPVHQNHPQMEGIQPGQPSLDRFCSGIPLWVMNASPWKPLTLMVVMGCLK